ncbi:MAG: alpha-ketoglutarate-dependent dioxygenase AlkB [Hahellaceae bacterium]|nr:alpha-ketoglutarate-dependent dioxygenase AlkB [Hahellaceae bacterium]
MQQSDLFGPESNGHDADVVNYPLIDGELILYKNVFSPLQAKHFFDVLMAEVIWQQDYLNFGGKSITIPRLQAWYGDAETAYTYSGLTLHPRPWSPALECIRQQVMTLAGEEFNSVLINRYRSGADSVAWHQDNEPELGQNPIIASVSLGATRSFHLKHKRYKRGENQLRRIIDLPDNSLLLMRGSLQHHWYHQLPKTRDLVGERINLTFRRIL